MSLELKNISLRVGADTHIYPTDLALNEGEFNILLGTTLAGKTTLMRLMAGLEKPSTGEVWFEGNNVTGKSVQKRDVAMVYQQFINYPNMTVFDNIASPLKVRGASKAEINEAVASAAEVLQLSPMLKRMPNELSGGQQQRIAIARALVKRAKLVLLDEPLANLDYKLREELREQLPKLFRDSGATVVYATTEPEEALLLGGKTAAMHEGRVTQFGATYEVYSKPNTQLTAKVFSDPPINIIEVNKRDNMIHLSEQAAWQAQGNIANLPDGDYTVGIRPHHVTLNAKNDHTVSVFGEVGLSELTGSESTMHVDVNGKTWVSLSHGIHQHNRGDKVELFINPSQCLFFNHEQQLVAS